MMSVLCLCAQILPNGQMLWTDGNRGAGWISLDGITFPVRPLRLSHESTSRVSDRQTCVVVNVTAFQAGQGYQAAHSQGPGSSHHVLAAGCW